MNGVWNVAMMGALLVAVGYGVWRIEGAINLLHMSWLRSLHTEPTGTPLDTLPPADDE